MSAIVSASSLRSVLGVSSSLYNDAYLDDIIDTAQGAVLPLLSQNSTAVIEYKLLSNVAYFYTRDVHNFVAGDSVVIAGLPSPFSATHTVVKADLLLYGCTNERRCRDPSDHSERHCNPIRLWCGHLLRRERQRRERNSCRLR